MNRRPILILGWMMLLAACFSLGGMKNSQNEQFRIAEARQTADAKVSDERDRRNTTKAFHEMVELLSAASTHGPSHPGWTKEQLQNDLPGNAPLETVASSEGGAATEADWAHPLSLQTWKFYFDADGHLSSWKNTGQHARRQPAPVSRATYEDGGEQARRAVAGWGKLIWIGVFVGWLFAGRHRLAVGHVLLALAIVVTVADLVSPVYTLRTVFSNDPVFPDALLVAISFAALATVSPAIRSLLDRPKVPRRLSIRWIAGLAALVLALVSTGWYGGVVGCVLAAGTFTYVVLASLFGLAPAPPDQTRAADADGPKPAVL